MKHFDIKPLVGVGPVKLGMDLQELEQEIGQPNFVDKNRVSFMKSCLFCDFDESGKVKAIEVAASENIVFEINGVDPFQTEAENLVNLIEKLDSYDKSNPELGYAYTFKQIQLGLWRPTVPEDDEDEDGRYFESVLIATLGYLK